MSEKDNKSDVAVNFVVWSMNGGPLPEGAVERFEAAIGKVQAELADEGYRLLTQTIRG